MNKSAKENILGRLREESRINLPENRAEEGEKNWPEWSIEERVHKFIEQLESDKAEVHRTSAKGWQKLLESLLKSKGISSMVYGSGRSYSETLEALKEKLPDLKLIQPEMVENGFKEKLFEVDATLTEAKAGIAETGTLVLWPDKVEPRLISLVPPIHIVLLDKKKLYNSFKEIITKESWRDSLPTNSVLISGPSKTADIEFNLAYGIHGPCELIVLLIDQDKSF